MARGVWRRSGEAFSAYCGRQIKAHDDEIERCRVLIGERQKQKYLGAAQFYALRAYEECKKRNEWREQMRAALITEGQDAKNSSDEFVQMVGRMKRHTANSSYGKFSPFHNPAIPAAIAETAREELTKWVAASDPTPRPEHYKTVRVETIDGRAFDIATYPLETVSRHWSEANQDATPEEVETALRTIQDGFTKLAKADRDAAREELERIVEQVLRDN